MTFPYSGYGLSRAVLFGCLAIVGFSGSHAAAQSTGTFIKTGDLNVPRIGHTATLLNDGRVLIAGGRSTTKGVTASLTSAELYDPASGKFSLTGNMTTGRSSHAATVLLDGRVLITGGDDGNYDGITSAELYDPATGTFSATGSMSVERAVATLLSTGKVLVSGTNDRSLELYDPATGTFGPTGYVKGSAYGVPATRLLNGDVLLGGYGFGPDAAVYNTATGNVQALTFPDLVHVRGYSETLLPDGKVLLAGGLTGFAGYCCTYLYDPSSQSFKTSGSLVDGRGYHSATLLTNGLVLIAGGYAGRPFDTDYASAELYDPASGTFTKAGAMTRARANHTATLLRDGRVLMVGGELLSEEPGGPQSTAELYVPGGPITTSACGKYATVNGYCRRIGILPWYAAIAGQWETDFELSAGSSQARFGYIMSSALTYDGIGHNLQLQDYRGNFIAESVDSLDLTGGYSARILGGVDCYGPLDCRTVASLGSLVITIDAQSTTALDTASVRATHKLLRGDGSTAAQADAQVTFRDQASSRWSAQVTDTPLSKQAQPGATTLSFAVANLSAGAQAVIVKVFDGSGKLVGSATTPVLIGASSLGSPFEEANGVGAVYAAPLSSFLGIELVPSAGDTVFHGTVTFEGAAGGKIAPLVVQMNGASITSIPAKPE